MYQDSNKLFYFFLNFEKIVGEPVILFALTTCRCHELAVSVVDLLLPLPLPVALQYNEQYLISTQRILLLSAGNTFCALVLFLSKFYLNSSILK